MNKMIPGIVPFAMLAALVFSGCQNTYSFKVDAINNPEIEGHKSYWIVNSNPAINEEDLEYKEVVQYVKTALSGKGLYEAPNIESADMIIDVSYGIGEPQVDFKTYSTPVYMEVGGGYRTVSQPVKDANGNVRMVTRTIYIPPRREVVDMQEQVIPITTYEKFLRLTARDNTIQDESEAPVQAWSIYVKNKDESDDLRKYLPLMAAAAVPYVGENTESQEVVKIKDTDESVGFVKAGM